MAQSKYLEFGIGAKYDFFKVKSSGGLFKTNFDFGAILHFSFSKKINEKLVWEAGFATNNYKLNFRVNSSDERIFVERELVSILRSNRIFYNFNYSKKINDKFDIAGSMGVSLIIMAKNPYDASLQRSYSYETSSGVESINYSIKTFGLTGSAILLNAGAKLNYLINNDINFVTTLGFTSGTGQVSKAEVNYAINSSTQYNKVIFETNGFSPFLSLGIQYKLKDKSK